MRIFIPTLGRANAQITWNNLPEKIQKMTTLVVQNHEAADYDDFPVVVLPPRVTCIGKTRQFLMETIPSSRNDKIVMLDDDLRFFVRRKDDMSKFLPATDAQIIGMFRAIEKSLDKFAHVGICSREGGNNMLGDEEAIRMTRVLAYRADVFWNEYIRFDRVQFKEDFDVTLQLLRKGYPNKVLAGWCHDQTRSNAPGGCSLTRTEEKMKSSALELQALHPDFVKVVTKATKTAWGGGERIDVRVAWKKALASAPVILRKLP